MYLVYEFLSSSWISMTLDKNWRFPPPLNDQEILYFLSQKFDASDDHSQYKAIKTLNCQFKFNNRPWRLSWEPVSEGRCYALVVMVGSQGVIVTLIAYCTNITGIFKATSIYYFVRPIIRCYSYMVSDYRSSEHLFIFKHRDMCACYVGIVNKKVLLQRCWVFKLKFKV